MEDKIKDAIKLLKSNGYIVHRWTQAMDEAADRCVEMEAECKNMDCDSCPCSVCLMQ